MLGRPAIQWSCHAPATCTEKREEAEARRHHVLYAKPKLPIGGVQGFEGVTQAGMACMQLLLLMCCICILLCLHLHAPTAHIRPDDILDAAAGICANMAESTLHRVSLTRPEITEGATRSAAGLLFSLNTC